ncbi:LysR family transcriptional regulator [Saccharospirillum sp. MSK14-1]|uniref:LysR substrate-binding domain-containing protein n=1 Tax=Saccharospirillum sp. MSK14-1 TaxID=1897632 RepID=UPI000D38369D|nr:LysR substrate-binding domain-containing protein [Saccharospirillum sp. MSK14-1]PTY36291.1 LysR family transcriptional regulator [Saccharospirillum sp. MSK14-1]
MSEVSAAALDLELLRSFQAAAQLGSLAAAAEQRHRTLGAISMQIKRLESVLDSQLLERGPRGVTLTATGEALLHESRELLRQHDGILARFTGRGLAGRVRLGLPEDYARELLKGLLPEFISRHPDVLLEAVTATSGELARQIQASKLSIAVVLDRPVALTGGRPLWQTNPVWVGARHSRFDPASSLPLAVHDADCPYRQLAVEALEHAKRPWHAVFTSTSIHAMEQAVEAGMAVSVIDRERMTPSMIELGPDDGLPVLPHCQANLHLAQQIDEPSRPAVEALAAMLEERLLDRGPWRWL